MVQFSGSTINADLQHEIIERHLAISQYPLRSVIQKKNFPLRNRTIALMSDATVIIEASDSSGLLHQGWEALRLGRYLFITKSIVENPALAGRDAELRSENPRR